jgi:hypothetical protein
VWQPDPEGKKEGHHRLYSEKEASEITDKELGGERRLKQTGMKE